MAAAFPPDCEVNSVGSKPAKEPSLLARPTPHIAATTAGQTRFRSGAFGRAVVVCRRAGEQLLGWF
eukprot:2050137-Pyramimonas_sp.AAC.1